MVVLGGGSLVFAREIYGLLMRPVLMLAAARRGVARLHVGDRRDQRADEDRPVRRHLPEHPGAAVADLGLRRAGPLRNERKLAGPFIVFGTAGVPRRARLFCYVMLLPQMFTFLLQKEDAAAITQRACRPRSCTKKTRCATCAWATSSAPAPGRGPPPASSQAPGEGQTS